MADDPDRDILPVKDSAAYNIPNNKIFSSLYEDVVQRQCASKLPRGDLEDRYLRLCEENMQLKKHCNKQHEKIKRLAAKLLRVVSDRKRVLTTTNDRQGVIAGNVLGDQHDRIQELEGTNAQLHERLLVLKNQLADHSHLHSAAHYSSSSRSPSRSPIRQTSQPTSGNIATNSEPPKHHKKMPSVDVRKNSPNREKRKMHKSGDTEWRKDQKSLSMDELELLRNQLNLMEQDMEILREESNAQISTLEEELVQDKRKQVADDVEMIRLKRGLKQQAVQLAALQAQSLATNKDVSTIQGALQQAREENDRLHYQLLQEKQKNLDIQKDIQKVESSSQSIKELQQAIADLKLENLTLKTHNDRLLQLSASGQEIEKARAQQLNERDWSLRNQLADVQTSLNGLLKEKDELKQALEEEKKTVSSLRQAHEELLSKFLEMQNQYRSLEQQLTGSIQMDEKDLDSKKIPSLKESRSVLQSLLEPTAEYPLHRPYERLKDSSHLFVSKAMSLSSHLMSNMTLLSDLNVRNIHTILENPSAEAKCGCSSPSAESCLCGGSSTCEAVGETRSCPPKGETCNTTEIELMQQSLTGASNCTATTLGSYTTTTSPPPLIATGAVSLKSISLSGNTAVHDAGTDSMSSCSSKLNQSNALSFETLSVDKTQMVTEETHSNPSTNQCLNLPPERNETISTTFPQEDSSFSNTQRTVSKSVAAAENNDVTKERALLGCSSGIDYSSGEVNAMAALPSNGTYTSNHLGTARELEKCRELLRVQYNLNGLYKKLLAKVRTQSMLTSIEQGNCTTAMARVSHHSTSSSRKLQSDKTSVDVNSDLLKKRSLLRVGVGQGLFELHAGYLQLSSEGVDRLDNGHSMFLTWVFYNQDVAYTPTKPGPEAQFDCSAVYRVQVDTEFLQYIQKEQCEINLYATLGDKSQLMAVGFLCFCELLDFPQNKLQAFVQLKSTWPEESAIVLGVLQCWYRLSCDVNLISRPKDELHNEVQFNEILQIKTLSPVSGSPPRGDSEGEMSNVLSPSKEDVKEDIGVISEERTPIDIEEQHSNSKEKSYLSLDSGTTEMNSLSTSLNQIPIDSHLESPDGIPPPVEPPEEPPKQISPYVYTKKQNVPSPITSLTVVDSSNSSLAEDTKPDLHSQTNSKDLTPFQKRMQQLRKGLNTGSESSSPDLDDVEQTTGPDSSIIIGHDDTMTEHYRTTDNSEESIELTEIPRTIEPLNSNEVVNRASVFSARSQKELEDQLSDAIRRSKEGLMENDSETRDLLEVLDTNSWNQHVHNSNSNASAPPEDVLSNTEPSIKSNENDVPAATKEPEKQNKDSNSPEVTVEIHWMTLDPESTPLKNPDVVQLYVEFAFLGLRGSELETAMSLPKPTTADQRLVYNYSRAFDVSKDTHKGRRVELRKLLSRSSLDHSIHFVVISEPLAEESSTKDCEELGQASVNIQTMLLEGHDYDPINIAILSVDGRQENIGNLNISIRGIETLIEIIND